MNEEVQIKLRVASFLLLQCSVCLLLTPFVSIPRNGMHPVATKPPSFRCQLEAVVEEAAELLLAS